MKWVTPNGYSRVIYKDLLECNHLMIAGCTGSGKSNAINGILRELLQCYAPCQKRIIILDPKRVDYQDYIGIPHLLRYANKYEDMVDTLDYCIKVMEDRYNEMEQKHIKKYDGYDIYLVIDEYADLHDIGGKQIETKIIRLCQLARAAKIHIILGTQRAVSCVSTRIRVNLDNRLALHTINKKESVNIIDVSGAESLPLTGKGLLQTPSELKRVDLPYVDDFEIQKLIRYWKSNSCKTY